MPRITKATAAARIQRRFRRKAPARRRPAKKGIYRNVTSNILSVKCRVPFTIRYDEMFLQTSGQTQDGSLHFNFINAPWRSINTDTVNRLYNSDFVSALALYQMYRLARVEYTIRRPRQYLAGVTLDPAESCGTEVLHTYMSNAADGVTNAIQSTVNLQPRINTSMPTSWIESVDNQSSRFHIHGTKQLIKRTWLPSTPFERKFRNKDIATDQELAFGGLHLRIKNKAIIPISAGTPANAQIMFEGYADVFMNYSRRT
jgi:hypothetical protein